MLAEYSSSGFARLPDALAPSEAAALAVECDRLWAIPGLVHVDNLRVQSRPGTAGEVVLDRLDPVVDLSERFQSLSTDERLLAPLREVLGGEARLFKSALIVKHPGARGYGLHQDWTYWQELGVAPEAMATVAVAIDGADEATGPIEVFSGSHDRLLTPPGVIGDPEVDHVDEGTVRALVAGPGDLFVLHPLVAHRSAPNHTSRTRRALFLRYASAACGELSERFYAWYREYQTAKRDPDARLRTFYR